MRYLRKVVSVLLCLSVVTPALGLELNHDSSISPNAATLQPGQFPRGFNLPESLRSIRPGSLAIRPRANVLAPGDVSFDWSSQLTPIRNQNPTGTCWAFASMGLFENNQVLFNGGTAANTDYSEQDLVNYYPNGPTTGGTQFMAFSYMALHGTALENVEPWLGSTTPQTWKSGNARLKRVNEMVCLGDVTGASAANIQAIKNALSYGPVYTGLSVATLENWSNAQGHGLGDMWWGSVVVPSTVTASGASDHAVCIVGWDDNKAQYGGSGTGAWKIRNSWGNGWGTGGYSWIGYGAANTGDSATYLPTSAVEDRSPITMAASDFAWDSSFGAGVSSVYMMAKMSVPTLPYGINQLQSVDVAVVNPNTTCQVDVYSSFDGSAPGTLLASGSRTVVNAGYYSVALTSPITVNEGETLAIRVRLSTPGATSYQFATTRDEWSSHVAGRYYYSFSGANGSWTDVSSDAPSYTNELIVRGKIVLLNTAAAQTWSIYR